MVFGCESSGRRAMLGAGGAKAFARRLTYVASPPLFYLSERPRAAGYGRGFGSFDTPCHRSSAEYFDGPVEGRGEGFDGCGDSGATVTATDSSNGFVRSSVQIARRVPAAAAAAGSYTLTATFQGFQKLEQRDVVLTVGEQAETAAGAERGLGHDRDG